MKLQNPQPMRSALGDLINETKVEVKSRLDAAQGYRRLLDYAERRLGYRPDLRNPKRFNEKIQWRKIHDHRPLLSNITGKFEMRDVVRERLGSAKAADILPTLLGQTDSATGFDLGNLPAEFVAKANHASGWNAFVTLDSPLEADLLRAQMALWLRRSYGKRKQEWAYRPNRRLVLFEELLRNSDGRLPDDMKFMVFGGKCAFIQWDDDRFGNHAQHFVDRDWQPLDFKWKAKETRPLPPKPECVDAMLEVAEAVAHDLDYARIDFMFTDSRFVLNEFTLYHNSGMEPFDPPHWDETFGALWTLPRL